MKATTRGVVVAGTAAAIVLSAWARLGAQVRSKSIDVDGPGGKLFVDDGGSGGIPVPFRALLRRERGPLDEPAAP